MDVSRFGGCQEDGTCLTAMCQEQFVDGPFLFQNDCAPVHKAKSIKTWMREFGVDELDWPAQSPDLNLIEYFCDELEWRLRVRPSRPTSLCDLTMRFWINGQKFP